MQAQIRDILYKPYVMRVLLVCTFILSHLPVFWYLVSPYEEFFVCCDVNRFFSAYAQKMSIGLAPYRDFESEYPPIALLLFFIPTLVAKRISGYQYLFVIEQLIFEVIGLFLIDALLRRMGKQRRENMFAMLGYIVLLASVGPILYSRYDIIVSVFVLTTLYTFQIGKRKMSWVMLAVSVMTKPYAIVIAPLLLITRLRESKNGILSILSELVVFIIALLAISLPFLLVSFQDFVYSFTYHAERGVQIETLYSSIVHVLFVFDIVSEVKMEFHYGAWELISPVSPFLATLAFLLTGTALISIYLAFYKAKHWQQTDKPIEYRVFHLYRVSVVAILSFILFYKVFSSQFLIWVYPLIPLVCTKPENRSKAMIIFLILIGAMTELIYPLNYVVAENRLWLNIVVVLVIRNMLLFFCLVWLVFWDRIEVRVPRLSFLLLTIFGVGVLELYPARYLLSGFPSKFNLILFLSVMGLFQFWKQSNSKESRPVKEL